MNKKQIILKTTTLYHIKRFIWVSSWTPHRSPTLPPFQGAQVQGEKKSDTVSQTWTLRTTPLCVTSWQPGRSRLQIQCYSWKVLTARFTEALGDKHRFPYHPKDSSLQHADSLCHRMGWVGFCLYLRYAHFPLITFHFSSKLFLKQTSLKAPSPMHAGDISSALIAIMVRVVQALQTSSCWLTMLPNGLGWVLFLFVLHTLSPLKQKCLKALSIMYAGDTCSVSIAIMVRVGRLCNC